MSDTIYTSRNCTDYDLVDQYRIQGNHVAVLDDCDACRGKA